MIGGYPWEHGYCWKQGREAAGLQKMLDAWIWGGAASAGCHLSRCTYNLRAALGAVTPQVLKMKRKGALVFQSWHQK